MNILVYEKNLNKEKNNYNLKEIICNKCIENARILIENYKIKLFGCKNGDEINNLSFEEFEKSQNINESKIEFEKCKKQNKGNAYENIFYKCNSCKMNLCPLCKSIVKINKILLNQKNFILFKIKNNKM